MHPASEGDALVLSWGKERSAHHALIDLGRESDYKTLRPALQKIGRFEFFAMTHIDADHIAGAMPLVKENMAPFTAEDVWFNAWHHLKNAGARLKQREDFEKLGAKQGEKLSAGILRFGWPWNRAFGPDGIVSLDSPSVRESIELAGGLKVILLSPGDEQLAKLEPMWMAELAKANLRPMDPDESPPDTTPGLEVLSALNVETLAAMPFVEDKAVPNGASIAFLAEFETRRVLLGADAHPGVIERALRKLGFSERSRLKLDLLKLCHHGSKANTSPTLLRILDCTHFAISTNGSKHNHPDHETIARILLNDPIRAKTLYFNVNQENASVWDRPDLREKYNFHCVMPSKETPGLTVEI
jgi:beta-lactamase superfamily II metal-dependent hydrolase